jgi:replication-associated recombination protein RarA
MAVLEIRNNEPSLPDELIGASIRKVADALYQTAQMYIEDDDIDEPLAIVLTGAPGIGKTTLANILALKLTGSNFAVITENGKEVGVHRVREYMDTMNESNLFSITGHQCWIINEGDKITDDGQTAFLSLLDQCPANHHIILTSNEDMDNWSERFQTRFEVFPIDSPVSTEITDGLIKRLAPKQLEGNEKLKKAWPQVVSVAAKACGGNVRQAIKELKAWKRKNRIL